MPITLSALARDEALASLQKYAETNLDQRLGNLAAADLLDYLLEEIGPAIYNQAVADVQERLQARVQEIDVELHHEGFTYWQRRAATRRR